MKYNVISAYKKLPPWGQAVAFIGAGVAAWVIYTRVRGTIRQRATLRDSRAMLQTVTSDLDKLQKQGIRPSYADSQYKIWADALTAAYSGWGTANDQSVWDAMKNDADVLKLITAFGIRTIPSGTLNPAPDFTGSLPAVVRDEHNFLGLSAINFTLKVKNIKYRF